MGLSKLVPRDRLHAALAGLQAGVFGGIAMMIWLALIAIWRGDSAWSLLNLLGSVFFPRRGFRPDFDFGSVAGMALHLTVTGLIGTLFGLVFACVPGRASRLLWALALGLLWYYVSFAFLWRWLSPALYYHYGRDAFLLSHLIFGAVLGLQTSVDESERNQAQTAQ